MGMPRRTAPDEVEHVLVEEGGELCWYERRTTFLGRFRRGAKRNEYWVDVNGVEVPMPTSEAVLKHFLDRRGG